MSTTYQIGDRPGADPTSDDKLGHAPFAEIIAKTISKQKSTDGLVIAINGSWGSGKTTIVNFINHYLDQEPETGRPVVVEFNPWWFSGQEHLTHSFFDQLYGRLFTLRKQVRTIDKHILGPLETFAKRFSGAPIPEAWAISLGALVLGWLRKLKNEDLIELKDQLSKRLRTWPQRLLVVIDDVDRLTPDEIRTLLGLVKGVADFPNVTYLLCFDRASVAKSLRERYLGLDGEAYLEKLVQVFYDLPQPRADVLQQFFLEMLEGAIGDVSESFDDVRWGNIYLDGLQALIRTPRDVVRICDLAAATYPAIASETNPVDFISMCVLQITCPRAIDVIRVNKPFFAGAHDRDGLLGPRKERLEEFHKWTDEIPEEERDAVKNVLARLFPKLSTLWGKLGSDANEEEWARDLRICSNDVFDNYFYLSVPPGSLSKERFDSALESLNRRNTAKRCFEELVAETRPDKTTLAWVFLDRLGNQVAEAVPSQQAATILASVLAEGHVLVTPKDRRVGLFGFGNDRRIERVVYQLLLKLDGETGEEALNAGFEIEGAEATLGRALFMIRHTLQKGEGGAKEFPITKEQSARLDTKYLGALRTIAGDGHLKSHQDMPYLVSAWLELDDQETVQTWVREAIQDDAILLKLLRLGVNDGHQTKGGDLVGKEFLQIDTDYLNRFFPVEEQVPRLKELIGSTSLTDREKRLVETILKKYVRA